MNVCENIDGDIVDCSNKELVKLTEDWLNVVYVEDLYIDDNYLTDISNLINLTQVDYVFQLQNNRLSNLHGLENLVKVYMIFDISHNILTNISALSNLTYVDILKMNYNSLTSLQGLENLKHICWMDVSHNSLTDISALSNFNFSQYYCDADEAHIYLNSNNLVNLNGLENLFSNMDNTVSWVFVYLHNNPNLTDISALSYINGNSPYVYIDEREYDTKISNDSYLCQHFDEIIRTWDPSHKSWICE